MNMLAPQGAVIGAYDVIVLDDFLLVVRVKRLARHCLKGTLPRSLFGRHSSAGINAVNWAHFETGLVRGRNQAGSMDQTVCSWVHICKTRRVSACSVVWRARAVRAFGHGPPAAGLRRAVPLLKNGRRAFLMKTAAALRQAGLAVAIRARGARCGSSKVSSRDGFEQIPAASPM